MKTLIRHFAVTTDLIAFLLAMALISACSQSSTSHLPDDGKLESVEEALDAETDFVAARFMQLCAVAHRFNLDPLPDEPNDPDYWHIAQDDELQRFGLANLRRKILEVPGGGGRFRDAQKIFAYEDDNTGDGVQLIANVQHRVSRKSQRRVRSDCVVYAKNSGGLSTCAAIGRLIGKAPESNVRMKDAGSHFMKWSVARSNETLHFKCSVHSLSQTETPSERFEGVVVSRITDHLQNSGKPVRNKTSHSIKTPDDDR